MVKASRMLKGKKIAFTIIVLFWSIFLTPLYSYSGDDSFTQKDRELLIRLDERLNQIDKRFEQIDKRFELIEKRFEQIDKRFEQVDKRFAELREDINKRFEQVDKRFGDINKRFEDVNKRFESLIQLMIAIVGAFVAIVAVTIGFALWDRRTMIRPFEDKVKKIEEDIANDKKKIAQLIDVLREYAKKNKEVAEILKSFSLL